LNVNKEAMPLSSEAAVKLTLPQLFSLFNMLFPGFTFKIKSRGVINIFNSQNSIDHHIIQ